MPEAVWQAVGCVVATWATSGRLAGTGAAGVQHSQTETHAPAFAFTISQAEASLANDASTIAERAINGRQSWRNVESMGSFTSGNGQSY
jgi:hypothetical protein